MVYERALAAFPMTHFLWLTYTRYLEAHLKIPAIVKGVFARAVRNTPWVGVVWARALNALERSGASGEEQSALYQRATSASLQVCRRLCSCRRWLASRLRCWVVGQTVRVMPCVSK